METSNNHFDKKRFEAFIDAIFAIILTILILELRVGEPDHGETLNTRQQMIRLIPSFVSYIGSFLLIVGIWIDHHMLFLNLTHLSKRYILMNMLFILFLSVVPFTTAFAGHHYQDSFAVAVLFVNYVIMNLLFGSLYGYAYRKNLLTTGFFINSKGVAIYSILGILGLTVAIPLAYINTYWSFALGIIIFSGHLFKKA